MTSPLPLTIVILTFNEAENLAACLDSLKDVSDDVHVVDSGSTDGTQAIAEARGVAVHTHRFEGFGSQRNWAIAQVPHRHPWVFHLDADERFTERLAAEIADKLATPEGCVGYYVANRLMLDGRWLKYTGNYPAYQMRLFRHERVRFEDHGHGQREISDGPLGYLREPYIHLGFSKGTRAWFQKHAEYAHREAIQAQSNRQSLTTELTGLISRDRVQRRRALKAISYRLPCRPLLRWLHTMILKRGVFDGRAGWTYARMLSIYEAMIAVELRSLDASQEGTGDG